MNPHILVIYLMHSVFVYRVERSQDEEEPLDCQCKCKALKVVTVVCLFAVRYVNPFWLVLAINIATVLYVYLFVPETIMPDPGAKLLSLRNYKAVWWLLSSGGGAAAAGRGFGRTKLWLYLLSYFVVLLVHVGAFSLYVLYELGAPLCWSSSLIGYGLALLDVASFVGLVVLRVTQRCLEESWVALMGLASNMAGLLVFALADTTPLMYTGEHHDCTNVPSAQFGSNSSQFGW